MRRWLATVVLTTALCLASTGCTVNPPGRDATLKPPAGHPVPAPSRSSETTSVPPVEIQHVAAIHDDTLRVDGKASLPTGALIRWQIGQAPSGDGTPLVYEEGTATVQANRFAFESDVSRVQRDEVTVWLLFYPHLQPSAISDLYGTTGRRLKGSHVTGHGDFRTIEYEFHVRKQ